MTSAPPRPARPLFVLDYDGTLAPIVADPAAAVPHPEAPAVLTRLATAHPLVVLTGRDLGALGRLLADARGPLDVRAIGLHGAEWGRPGHADGLAPELEAVAADLAAMRAAVPDGPGIVVEDKGAAFAVHYRAAPDPAAALASLDAWAASTPAGLEAVRGKAVVELRAVGVSKGTAAARLAAEHAACTPVALGDDTTDEDTFAALHAAHPDAVTVKVGPGETVARHRLPDVDAAVAYLSGFAPASRASELASGV